MALFSENPVMQRELLVNLRLPRAFLLLAIYQGFLALIVILAWPQEARLDLSQTPDSARLLSDLFFLGQFVLASIMAPSFAAGAITGEKERQTYEMLLASPLRPEAIVLGKAVASLSHLGLLVFTSLPIVMLCLPLGGVSLYEVLGAYVGMLLMVLAFGMISLACSSFFGRTLSSLLVSYLMILPLAAGAVAIWVMLRDRGELRLELIFAALPPLVAAVSLILHFVISGRLLYPADLGSEGKEVVDEDEENKRAIGLVIHRDRFPDRLFAPPRRTDLMPDGTNPVLDKEIYSEIFAQGTLMLRLVIQISMLLAIPAMAALLFFYPGLCWLYIAYTLIFNLLVGPVFSAGAITSERERQTLDLLLTTNLSPSKILMAKLKSGLRVSLVLTGFLYWPVLLACILLTTYWTNLPIMAAYVAIALVACITASMVALTASTLMNKTSHALMASYIILGLLFLAPLAADWFATRFLSPSVSEVVSEIALVSPFEALRVQPFYDVQGNGGLRGYGSNFARDSWSLPIGLAPWLPLIKHLSLWLVVNLSLFGAMHQAFRVRWRVAENRN
ncbi:MAG: ABC transporter permease [Pirellulaceae bacterium]|nr:ABC transporter permease [Planctomycetales bacterium]